MHEIGNQHAEPRIQPKKRQPIRLMDWPDVQRQLMQACTSQRVADLADSIGVSRENLRRLSVGWSAPHSAFSFPMRDAKSNIVGMRLRTIAAKKFAITGSNDGLVIPTEMSGDGPLMICEGPTDTAAMLDIGFDAIGRPSCNSGVRQILEYLRDTKREPIIAANYDERKTRPDGSSFFPGQDGAESLAAELFGSTKIIYPLREKDFRAWINAGATRAAIQSVIANTRYFRRKAG